MSSHLFASLSILWGRWYRGAYVGNVPGCSNAQNHAFALCRARVVAIGKGVP